MSSIATSEEINRNPRRFLRNAAMTLAAAELATMSSAKAQSSKKIPPIKPGTNTSFGSLKQISAGLLNVAYAEVGPANGPAVVLLPVSGPAAKPQPEAHQRSEFSL